MFAEEENWQEQNASAGIMIAVAFVLELLVIAMAEAVLAWVLMLFAGLNLISVK